MTIDRTEKVREKFLAVPYQMVLAFSWKKRGCFPSCAGRRMAQQAAHLELGTGSHL
ncbi:MAG: hypothetical protein V3U27_11850 [Candidatus Tectomicrobia bacterium]